MDTTNNTPTVLSLCTGYGGIERGLSLAGVKHRVIAHVEIEAFAIANLVAKMEEGRMDAAPIWTDLKTLPVGVFRARVDILTGGYPCQPFSLAGRRQGFADQRHIWPYMAKAISTIRPRVVFLENVEGHTGLGLSTVLRDLEKLGYRTTWGIFSAAEAGAPHQRRRVFIMAHAEGFRAQRLWPSWVEESDTHGQTELPMCESEGGEPADWKAEPSMGRVVDGCPNRVDRLRLLGNAVVPQTAAKAWITLNEGIKK